MKTGERASDASQLACLPYVLTFNGSWSQALFCSDFVAFLHVSLPCLFQSKGLDACPLEDDGGG